MNLNNPELQLLESIYAVTEEGNSPAHVSQRELANTAGLSLGLTNTLLKRFIERGWVKLLHVDGRKIKYALTPSGMEEIAVRAVDYFARAAQNASLYRKKIDVFIERIAHQGYENVLLLGPAELDFLFDYACIKHGIQFYKCYKVCAQELRAQHLKYERLVAVYADNLRGDGGAENDSAEGMKRRLGLPHAVPLIKFSQVLLNSGEKELYGPH
jgi:DNA-binding MarR family transcriptional regulator